ncbi:MAG: hypothetical protein ACLFQX_09925 [Candidatus Kapaibacterium sp.]
MAKKPNKNKADLPGLSKGKSFDAVGKDAPEIREKRKYKAGKHLVDNILKSNEPVPSQPSLFDTLMETTREKVSQSGAEIKILNRKGEGIKLTKGEYKLLLCMAKLLADKSQTTNKEAPDYFMGNVAAIQPNTYKMVHRGGGTIERKYPILAFTVYELTREYVGGGSVSGKNMEDVRNILIGLADDVDKKALLRYNIHVEHGNGKEDHYEIETFDSLIRLYDVKKTRTENGEVTEIKKEQTVQLHPVFADQIDKMYIQLPLPQYVIEAYGSTSVSAVTQKFILELSRAYSNRLRLDKDEEGNLIYIIGANKLFWKIADNYMNPQSGKPERPQTLEKYFLKSVETAQKLGLLLAFEESEKKSGERMFKFLISKDW